MSAMLSIRAPREWELAELNAGETQRAHAALSHGVRGRWRVGLLRVVTRVAGLVDVGIACCCECYERRARGVPAPVHGEQ